MRQLIRDYGECVETPQGALQYLKGAAAAGPLSVGQYVRQVVRLAHPALGDLHATATDGARLSDDHHAMVTRLIAAGHDRWGPREMARALPSLLRWAAQAQFDPSRVEGSIELRVRRMGSPYTLQAVPAWEAWRAGVPAWVYRALYGARPAPHGYPAPGPLVGRLPRRQLSGARLEAWRRAGRAAARHSVEKTTLMFTFKALEQLGRLSPELQEAALRGVEMRDGRPIVPSQLNWDYACEMQALFLRRPELRGAMARGKRRPPDLVCPAYPKAPPHMAARLLLGDSPQQLAEARQPGLALTRKEAHEWLSCAPNVHPGTHLLGLTSDQYHRLAREPAVLGWFVEQRRRGRLEELYRERTLRHQGQAYRFRYVDRLDEIRDLDVYDGPSIRVAFERAAERSVKGAFATLREDHRVITAWPSHWPTQPPGWVLLDTPAKLVLRGEQEHHCVGGFAPAVAAKTAYIVAVDRDGDRSTVEFGPSRTIRQHHGPANSQPAAALAAEVLAFAAHPHG